VLPLVQGREQGWPIWTWACLGLAPVLLAAFLRRQSRQARSGRIPLVDLGWWRERAFRFGTATQFLFWCGQASYFLVLALWLQAGRGLTALGSGLVFTAVAGPYLLSSLRAAALLGRYGRRVIVAGALLLAAGHGLAALAVVAGGGVAAVVPGMALAGAGTGLCLAPITATVLAHADVRRVGAVSGVLSTLQQVGNAVGVAVLGLVFFGGHGTDRAFVLSSVFLATLLAVVALVAGRLPRPADAR
jgi:Na+/melibiose symporter-like transporter